MARYGTGFSNREFHDLAEVKEYIRDVLRELMEDNNLDLVYRITRDRSEAVKEVDVTVQLHPH